MLLLTHCLLQLLLPSHMLPPKHCFWVFVPHPLELEALLQLSVLSFFYAVITEEFEVSIDVIFAVD